MSTVHPCQWYIEPLDTHTKNFFSSFTLLLYGHNRQLCDDQKAHDVWPCGTSIQPIKKLEKVEKHLSYRIYRKGYDEVVRLIKEIGAK